MRTPGIAPGRQLQTAARSSVVKLAGFLCLVGEDGQKGWLPWAPNGGKVGCVISCAAVKSGSVATSPDVISITHLLGIRKLLGISNTYGTHQ